MSFSCYIRGHLYSSEPIASSVYTYFVAFSFTVMQQRSHVSSLVGAAVPTFSSGGPPAARRWAVSIDFAAAAGS